MPPLIEEGKPAEVRKTKSDLGLSHLLHGRDVDHGWPHSGDESRHIGRSRKDRSRRERSGDRLRRIRR